MKRKDTLLIFELLLAALLLSACAGMAPEGSRDDGNHISRVWPASPAEPKIAFVRTIKVPQDMGIKKSIFRRFMNLFSGRAESFLVHPSGLAENAGVLYIADPGAQSVWILDTTQNRMTRVHQLGDFALVSPVAVAVRPDGAVFVADSVTAKVILLDRKGKLLSQVVDTGLQRPAGLVYDPGNERLYIADSLAQKIFVYKPEGKRILSWGRRGSAAGEFNYPTYLTLSRQGELLVTDSLNFRIQAFNPRGEFLWQFGEHGDTSGTLAAPKGVAVDSGGHVYIVDALFDAVQLFQKDGTLLMSFGGHGSGAGQFWLPAGIFVTADDRIYVADTYNNQIQEFKFMHADELAQPEE